MFHQRDIVRAFSFLFVLFVSGLAALAITLAPTPSPLAVSHLSAHRVPVASAAPESDVILAKQSPGVKFAPAYFMSFYSYPASIAVGDLNNDGAVDLVVGDHYSNEGYVLLGNGDGTFEQPATYYLGGSGVLSIAIGDLNGDGIPDLVAASPCPASGSCTGDEGIISVLLGNGDGTFRAAVSYSAGSYASDSVAIADVNRDGNPDLVVANWCQSYSCSKGSDEGVVSVLLGNGDGTFQAPMNFSSGAIGATTVAIGDVNGDRKPDLIVGNGCLSDADCNGGIVSVLLGKGNGTFKPAVTYSSGGYDATSVALGDLNGDGHLDIVASDVCLNLDKCKYGLGPGGLGVLIGKGDGTFQPVVSYTTGGLWATSVAVGDVNDDGKLDIVVGNLCGATDRFGDCNLGGTVGVLPGNGDGTFRDPKKYNSGGSQSTSVAIGDLNGDGRPDLAVADEDGGIGILLNQLLIPTKTTLAASPTPAGMNQPVTLTATVGAPIANGETVTFYDGNTVLGTGSTTNSVATLMTSFFKPKNYTIKADYPGDAFHRKSSGTVKLVVNP